MLCIGIWRIGTRPFENVCERERQVFMVARRGCERFGGLLRGAKSCYGLCAAAVAAASIYLGVRDSSKFFFLSF